MCIYLHAYVSVYISDAPAPGPAQLRSIPSRMGYDDHGFVFVAGVSCV